MKFARIVIVVFLGLVPVPALRAGSLGTNVVAMFPKNVSEFAYADLSEARKLSWYAQFKSQTLPPRFTELEHFLSAAGVNPNLQIDQIAWSIGAENANDDRATPSVDQLLGVALGNFDPESAKNYYKAHKIAGLDVRAFTLYPCSGCDNISIVFLDASTMAFGNPRLLQELIEVRSGVADSLLQNDKMFPLINGINGRGVFWGVLNTAGTRKAIGQIVPEALQFPQAGKLLNKINGMVIRVEGSSDLEAHIELISDSPEACATISQLLQAGVLLRRYQASQSDPQLADLLGGVRIAPNGEGLEVSLSISNDQLVDLIKHNTFSIGR